MGISNDVLSYYYVVSHFLNSLEMSIGYISLLFSLREIPYCLFFQQFSCLARCVFTLYYPIVNIDVFLSLLLHIFILQGCDVITQLKNNSCCFPLVLRIYMNKILAPKQDKIRP